MRSVQGPPDFSGGPFFLRKNSPPRANRLGDKVLTSTLYSIILGDMDTAFFSNWTTQLRKGTLELCVLSALSGRRLYGYDIIKRLRGVDGLMIGEGTVYPILSRFHREGLVITCLLYTSPSPRDS